MKLFLITQEVNSSYDTYDSAVVAAENMDDAKKHTCEELGLYGSWAAFEDLDGKEIGIADESYTDMIIICASYNAG